MEYNIVDLFERHFGNKNYKVKDLIVPDMKMLFILESPNMDALHYGIPATGRIGKFMVRGLNLPQGISFGELANNHPELSISIMNVLETVWQKNMTMPKEYECEIYYWKALMQAMYEIKHIESVSDLESYLHYGYSATMLETILKSYLERLTSYLAQVHNEELMICVCGKFANACMEYFVKNGLTFPYGTLVVDLRHPSYNWWLRDKDDWMMDFVKEVVKTRVECWMKFRSYK